MPYNTVLKTNDAKRLKTIIEVKVAVYIFFMIKEEKCILNNEDFRLAAIFFWTPWTTYTLWEVLNMQSLRTNYNLNSVPPIISIIFIVLQGRYITLCRGKNESSIIKGKEA